MSKHIFQNLTSNINEVQQKEEVNIDVSIAKLFMKHIPFMFLCFKLN